LLENIVNAVALNSFMENLDSFWSGEQMVYDFKASLSCTGAWGILAR
jgi:hypothetical protein